MARDTSPQCKQCRREGQKLFLKGERCLTDKCGVERRSYPPGEHGRGRQKQSEYRVQLREKQKARRYYGVLEKQFRTYYDKASRQPGITGENLLRILECRFDNVLVRLGFAASRRQARQLIRHGHWAVNGRRVDIPSYQVRESDVIAVQGRLRRRDGRSATRPSWWRRSRPGCRPTTTSSPRRCCASPSARRSPRRCRSSSSSSCTRSSAPPCPRAPLPAAAPRDGSPEHLRHDVRTLMLDFQIPRITAESVEDNRGQFVVEPLDRGFGYTFGNSLRRVLLASLAGAAVTSVRIEGVAHEFSTIKGVTEDVTDIVLNLKGIVCRMHSDATEVEAPLVVTGPGEITAARHRPAVRRRDPQPGRAHRHAREEDQARALPDDRPRPRLPPGGGEQVARPADRRDPDRLDLLAGAPRRLLGRAGARRPADRLRQADARHRDRRLDRPAGRAARGRGDPDLVAVDLHRRGPHRGAARRPGRHGRARQRRRCRRLPCGAGGRAGGRRWTTS